MSKEEIALQLTLKAIERISPPYASEAHTSEEYNQKFSKQLCDFYNYLYKNLDNTIEV